MHVNPRREERGAAEVDSRRGLHRGLRDEEVGRDRRDQHDDEPEPEDPAVRQVVDDQAAQHEPGAAADPERGRDEADAGGHALARELVADDPEGRREDRAARALHGPPRDQQQVDREDPG
jgi:hypothetical protein